MRQTPVRAVASGIVALVAGFLSYPAAHAGALDDAIEETVKAHKAARKSQARVDDVSDATASLLSQYRINEEQLDASSVYNGQLDKLISSQEEEMASLREQIDGIKSMSRNLTPLMLAMLDSLEKVVELDVPFLLEERRKRVAKLRKMVDRADVTTAEKFRRLLEAYQVESEYGRTIEAYMGTLDLEKTQRAVEFLRIGRVALVYQALDGREAGAWDQEKRKWVVLPSGQLSSVRKGLRIARRQAPPDLIRIPVSAPRATP